VKTQNYFIVARRWNGQGSQQAAATTTGGECESTRSSGCLLQQWIINKFTNVRDFGAAGQMLCKSSSGQPRLFCFVINGELTSFKYCVAAQLFAFTHYDNHNIIIKRHLNIKSLSIHMLNKCGWAHLNVANVILLLCFGSVHLPSMTISWMSLAFGFK